jgi:hypothetical protein
LASGQNENRMKESETMNEDLEKERLENERLRFEHELWQRRQILGSLYGGLIVTALLFPGCGYGSVCLATTVPVILSIIGIGASISGKLWKHVPIALVLFAITFYFAIHSKQ